MPTIRRFANCKLALDADDHMLPHVHIEGRTFRAVVELDTLRVRAGNIRHVPEVMAWAGANAGLLRQEWNRLNRRA